MSLIEALHWRYATKRMNGEKVSEEKIENILEAVRLSASSMGLQPYTIFVIENDELKRKIKPVAFNQPQIEECSHLLVFAAWNDISDTAIEEYIKDVAETRGASLESLEDFKQNLLNYVKGRSKENLHEWTARQAYIAFGTALAAAALEKVDATPMEGFDPAKLDEILGLKEKGMRSVTMLPLGYRDVEQDFLVNQNKVRRSKEKLIMELA